MKSSLRKKKLNPTRDIFEEAQTKIYSLMHRDSFPRSLFNILNSETLSCTVNVQVLDFEGLQRRLTVVSQGGVFEKK